MYGVLSCNNGKRRKQKGLLDITRQIGPGFIYSRTKNLPKKAVYS